MKICLDQNVCHRSDRNTPVGLNNKIEPLSFGLQFVLAISISIYSSNLDTVSELLVVFILVSPICITVSQRLILTSY
jgi:hypothetical protein